MYKDQALKPSDLARDFVVLKFTCEGVDIARMMGGRLITGNTSSADTQSVENTKIQLQ